MNVEETVVQHLLQCVRLMKNGEFSAAGLDLVKQVLEKMLTATNNAIEKIIK